MNAERNTQEERSDILNMSNSNGKYYKNPDVSDDERRKYFWKRMREEIKRFNDLSETTGNGSFERRARIYLRQIKESDHITFRMLTYVLFHKNTKLMALDPYPIGKSIQYWLLKNWIGVRLPVLLHKFRYETNEKKFLSIVQGLRTNPQTGDREIIVLNATPRKRPEEARALEEFTTAANKSGNSKKRMAKNILKVGNMKTKEREREFRRYIDEFF